MKMKQVAVGIFLLFVGTCVVPINAIATPSSQNFGDTTRLKIDSTPPYVMVTKPQKGWWYLFSLERKSPIRDVILIIGKINVTANATDTESGVNRVEFFVDDVLRWSDTTEPYFWIWSDKKPFSSYTLTAVAYNNAGDKNSDTLKVLKIF